jgi:hypothetical protein
MGEDAEVAPGFNESLSLLFDTTKYALGALDDKWIVFGASDVDVVLNDGPNSRGDENSWQIVRVQTDVGCTNPKSIASTPLGLIFQSARGIELLDRGLVISPIGKPAEDTLAAYPVITSAVVVAVVNEVRFTCSNTDGTKGLVLVFDYLRRAWYTRIYFDSNFLAGSAAFVDAALVDGVYTMLTAFGTVYRETSAHCRDSGQFVEMRVSVPVYSTTIASWQRLRDIFVIGESRSDHKLFVEVSRDFTEAPEQTRTFIEGSPVTSIGPFEQARVTPKHQLRQAAVVTIYDAAPDPVEGGLPIGTGEGPILEKLALDVEFQEGPARIAAGKRG